MTVTILAGTRRSVSNGVLSQRVFSQVIEKLMVEPVGSSQLPGPFATRSLPGDDLAVTIQHSLRDTFRARPEGPPNLYQLRGRWEWVTLLVELISPPQQLPHTSNRSSQASLECRESLVQEYTTSGGPRLRIKFTARSLRASGKDFRLVVGLVARPSAPSIAARGRRDPVRFPNERRQP